MKRHGGRAAVLLFTTIALALSATGAQGVPRQDPAHCRGQPELKPLEALQVRTTSGVHSFKVEVADTPREREYGLMCRRVLGPARGMLFIFPTVERQAFWMRNTLISLDIIYIGADGRVVSVSRGRPLDESPLWSAGPAIAVLELAAGRGAEIGLAPGDRVFHRIFKRD